MYRNTVQDILYATEPVLREYMVHVVRVSLLNTHGFHVDELQIAQLSSRVARKEQNQYPSLFERKGAGSTMVCTQHGEHNLVRRLEIIDSGSMEVMPCNA